MDHSFATDLDTIVARYGEPLRHIALLPIIDFEPVNMADRVGEVCMVIRRPNGSLLTAIKTTYPPGCHRLLTGGIHHGEPILEALLREVAEETSLDVTVRRLLAVVDYRDAQTGTEVFTTIAFLLDETGGTLSCADPTEQHEEFFEITADDLLGRANALEHIDPSFSAASNQDWAAWGRFRAIIHRMVWECFQ